MALTPEDVRKKEFSTVRLREGYEMDEVDAFLDEVEAELTRLLRENEDLRARLAAASRPPAVEAEAAAPAEAAPAPAPAAAPPAAPVPTPAPAAAAVSPTDQAVKMLELAQRTADEHVSAAKAEAEKLVAAARTEAQRVTADLQREQSVLQGRIDQLKAFEREYRTRLRSYLEGQLRELESHGSAEPPIPPAMAAASAPAPAAAPPVAPPAPSAQPQPPQGPQAPAAGPGQPAQPPRPATPFAPPTAPPVQAPSGD